MKAVSVLALGILLLAVVASGVAVVWARHQNRVTFIELTRLQSRRDALKVTFGRLEIERATWARPSRIERIAHGKLGMISPPAQSVEMIRE